MKYEEEPGPCGIYGAGEVEDYTVNIIGQGPYAYFNYNDNDLTVHFMDESICASCNLVSWNWNFGDGSTSNMKNPVHTYSTEGNYTVSLTVTSNQTPSATDSAAKDIFSNSLPKEGEIFTLLPQSRIFNCSGLMPLNNCTMWDMTMPQSNLMNGMASLKFLPRLI